MTQFNIKLAGRLRFGAAAASHRRTALGLALLAWTCVGAAQSAFYYDGSSQRALTLQPSLIAEFADRSAAATRSTTATTPFVTLHSTSAAMTRSAHSQSSPVYREGHSPAGRLMALPGGVIVNFQPDWSEAQIQAWAAAGGYTLGRRLNIQGNWYTVQTAAGQVALDTANAIYQSGVVISASPNWWKHTVTR